MRYHYTIIMPDGERHEAEFGHELRPGDILLGRGQPYAGHMVTAIDQERDGRRDVRVKPRP